MLGLKNLSIVTALAVASCAVMPAAAQDTCDEFEKWRNHVQDDYSEALIWQGTDLQEKLIQIWSNPQTGTWTLLVSDSKTGETCYGGAGKWNERVPYVPATPGNPS